MELDLQTSSLKKKYQNKLKFLLFQLPVSKEFVVTVTEFLYQGGERLGGETSGSERKGVMQWTGSELKSETWKKRKHKAKFGDLMELKEEFLIHALLLFIT